VKTHLWELSCGWFPGTAVQPVNGASERPQPVRHLTQGFGGQEQATLDKARIDIIIFD
jgi:hypothetical protein